MTLNTSVAENKPHEDFKLGDWICRVLREVIHRGEDRIFVPVEESSKKLVCILFGL